MNKFKIVGEILNLKRWDFNTGNSKVSFTLKFYVTQKKFSYINCETWNRAMVEGLRDGMVIELTNYYPETQSWVNNQGITQYKHVVTINEMEIVAQQAQVQTPPKAEIPFEIPQKQFEPDWMKELDETPTPQTPTYEDIVNINKQYQHGMITKPGIIATKDGTVTTTDVLLKHFEQDED